MANVHGWFLGNSTWWRISQIGADVSYYCILRGFFTLAESHVELGKRDGVTCAVGCFSWDTERRCAGLAGWGHTGLESGDRSASWGLCQQLDMWSCLSLGRLSFTICSKDSDSDFHNSYGTGILWWDSEPVQMNLDLLLILRLLMLFLLPTSFLHESWEFIRLTCNNRKQCSMNTS